MGVGRGIGVGRCGEKGEYVRFGEVGVVVRLGWGE